MDRQTVNAKSQKTTHTNKGQRRLTRLRASKCWHNASLGIRSKCDYHSTSRERQRHLLPFQKIHGQNIRTYRSACRLSTDPQCGLCRSNIILGLKTRSQGVTDYRLPESERVERRDEASVERARIGHRDTRHAKVKCRTGTHEHGSQKVRPQLGGITQDRTNPWEVAISRGSPVEPYARCDLTPSSPRTSPGQGRRQHQQFHGTQGIRGHSHLPRLPAGPDGRRVPVRPTKKAPHRCESPRAASSSFTPRLSPSLTTGAPLTSVPPENASAN